MEARRGVRLGVAGWLVSASILFGLMSGAAHGEGFYTRKDELSCGNTVVQAFTTCTEDSKEVYASACTEQHFLFVNKKTGASVRVQRSAKPVANHGPRGRGAGILYEGLARDWTCLHSRAGFYVFIGFSRKRRTDHLGWEELWDLEGRKIDSNKGDSDAAWDRFYKIWNSKRLVTHPLPIMDFVPIQLFKTDRVDTRR